jgi:hypothetical protein
MPLTARCSTKWTEHAEGETVLIPSDDESSDESYEEPVLTDAQLLDVREKRIDWFFYCLWRQTLSHEEAVALLADPGTGRPS